MTTAATCRISLRQTSDGNETVAHIYDAFLARRGVVPNMFKTWAHVPALLETAAPFSWAIFAEGALPGFYKELVGTRIARLEGCEYAAKAHQALALAKGATEDQVAALDGPAQGPFTAREKLGFSYAEHVWRGTVDDESFAVARNEFTEAEIVELTAVVAGLLCFMRFITTLEIPLTPRPGAVPE
jgi:AhpD family alkylhydroperoxidase